LQSRFPIDDVFLHSGDIRDQVAKLSSRTPSTPAQANLIRYTLIHKWRKNRTGVLTHPRGDQQAGHATHRYFAAHTMRDEIKIRAPGYIDRHFGQGIVTTNLNKVNSLHHRAEILMYLGRQISREKRPAKFLTEFYKYGSPSNTWQSLVTIGQATSEIRRRKKKI